MSEAPRSVVDTVAGIAGELGGTVGVAARNLAGGAGVHLNADELFPLASVFKIPVMVEVLRRVDAGDVRLDERLTLREADKSPGSTLIHLQEGLQPSVRDLLYLMITLSDNTATDMLWRRVGLESVNRTMRELGLATIDCALPNREYFLFETGLGEDWAGLSGPEIVARWRELEARDGRAAALARILEEHEHLSGAAFQHHWDRRWGYDDSLGFEDAFAVDQELDNRGSPRDVAELLAMVAEARCASAPSCRLMVEIMGRQEWREKIPAGLPDGVFVANKTGGVTGTSNDAAIVCGPGHVPVVMVVFCKGLDREQTRRAPAAIARIAGVLHEYLGDGAGRGPASDPAAGLCREAGAA
jgi:beta-lactamase class A